MRQEDPRRPASRSLAKTAGRMRQMMRGCAPKTTSSAPKVSLNPHYFHTPGKATLTVPEGRIQVVVTKEL